MIDGRARAAPFYLQGQVGRLFSLYYASVRGDVTPCAGVVHVPAFAEEMNKSRRMVAMQARALAEEGISVLVFDLYGTGDSGGNFEDASWDIWRADLGRAVAWLAKTVTGPVYLWGLRAGCLLAADYAAKTDCAIDGLVFWQPVDSGAQSVQQLRRLHLASSLTQTGDRVQLDSTRTIDATTEIAGYLISDALIDQLQGVYMSDFQESIDIPVHRLEISPDFHEKKPPALGRHDDGDSKSSWFISESKIAGPRFWATQEISQAPGLVEITTQLLSGTASQAVASPQRAPRSLPPSEVVVASTLSDVNDIEEIPVDFACQGCRLYGVLHRPRSRVRSGVLIVVGGPQYRIGSHRQFVLIARFLARHSIPVLRFDYRGMGDSEGEQQHYANAQPDIRCAIDYFRRELPGLEGIVIWGLCDAATIASLYAPGDTRITGLVLVNPWLRSKRTGAMAYLRHYYPGKLFSQDLWRRIAKGELLYRDALYSFVDMVRTAFGKVDTDELSAGSGELVSNSNLESKLAESVLEALVRFQGQIFLVLSGQDLTAKEFKDISGRSRMWHDLLDAERVTSRELTEADHTFSSAPWQERLAHWTADWIQSVGQNMAPVDKDARVPHRGPPVDAA